MKEKVILNIKKRIELLSEYCSKILSMNNVFVFYGDLNCIVLELEKLNPSWLSDIRPILNNKLIKYVDSKGFNLIDLEGSVISIDSLKSMDLKVVNQYFEKIVCLSSEHSVPCLLEEDIEKFKNENNIK